MNKKMKLEKFKEKNKKKLGVLLFTIICMILIGSVILYKTFASFTVSKDFNMINGNIQGMGDIEFAFYLNGALSKTMPSNYTDYDLDEKESYCGLGDKKLEEMNIEYHRQDGTISIQGLTSTKTKCYLYFKTYDKEVGMIKLTSNSADAEDIWAYKDSINKIVFENKIEPKVTYDHSYDISVKQDGSVMAYLVKNEDNMYTCYIQGNKKIKTNTNSASLFSQFKKVKTLEGMEYLDTSETTNMTNMFREMESLTEIDLSHFDTSQVTDMNSMFNNNYKLEFLDLGESFDTSKVNNMNGMFYASSSLKYIKYGNKFVRKPDSDITNMFGYAPNANKPTGESWNDVSW